MDFITCECFTIFFSKAKDLCSEKDEKKSKLKLTIDGIIILYIKVLTNNTIT